MTEKNKKLIVILAIETSCDDTGIALLRCEGELKAPKFEILKNIVSSQIKVHRPFGGVVPNLAKREHIKNLPKILDNLGFPDAKFKKAVDMIAVTVGPGLEPALWTGINFAQEIAARLQKPLIGVNHLEGHLYSNWLPRRSTFNARPKIVFPAVALIVSGGHTILLNMESATKWTKLGETVDDAAGEAFDKVAKMLKLPYPGGPEIQKIARSGDAHAIRFPRPMLNQKNYNFSFSGLKTSVLYYLRDNEAPPPQSRGGIERNSSEAPQSGAKENKNIKKEDVAASFEQAVVDILTRKTIRAAQESKALSILLCGGVAANKSLRDSLKKAAYELAVDFFTPDVEFNTDNAAAIAAAAYINLFNKNKSLPLKAQGDLTI